MSQSYMFPLALGCMAIGMTLAHCGGNYAKKRLELRHNELPLQVRMYDTDRNGFLTRDETNAIPPARLEIVLRDYIIAKQKK